MTIKQIEIRIAEVETSYQRQLNLAGKPGYDHNLTEVLKKDLDWLQEQKNMAAEKKKTNLIIAVSGYADYT